MKIIKDLSFSSLERSVRAVPVVKSAFIFSFTPQKSRRNVMTSMYTNETDQEFYDSDEWQEIRADIIERDGYMCRTCQSIDQLSVHHIYRESISI